MTTLSKLGRAFVALPAFFILLAALEVSAQYWQLATLVAIVSLSLTNTPLRPFARAVGVVILCMAVIARLQQM